VTRRAPYRMGASSQRYGLNPAFVLLLRALGSPRQVYRQLPRAVRLHEGYPHSRLDCLGTQGLMSVVPELFDLPPATVVHEECQSDGDRTCVYRVTWARRGSPRWWGGRRGRADVHELVALRGQLEATRGWCTSRSWRAARSWTSPRWSNG
jgi:hypothetical protein